MMFGAQTVGFVTVTRGAPDPNGIRTETRTQVNVSGCRFRPLRINEQNGVFDTSTEVWKCTAPAHPAVLAADSLGEVVFDGTDTPQRGDDDVNVFQIDGEIQPKPDIGGVWHHVTVFAKRQKG